MPKKRKKSAVAYRLNPEAYAHKATYERAREMLEEDAARDYALNFIAALIAVSVGILWIIAHPLWP